MNVPFVDFNAWGPEYFKQIQDTVSQVISEGTFIGGTYVTSFEKQFAHYCGVRHCIGTGNATDAIFIALRAIGVGPGDEVITAANSFIATAEAVTMTGAKVVFADCDPETYTIDIVDLKKRLTSRTKAIIAVHLYGQPADMGPILDLARSKGIRVIEDAAQAHGATYQGRRVGSLADIACFSFYPAKNLGALGDGGCIVTNDDALASWMRKFANHGRMAKFDHEFEGVNSRLDTIHAAVLSVKLAYLDAWNESRRQAAKLYRKRLSKANLPYIAEPEDRQGVYHLFVTRVRDREKVRTKLAEAGIATGIHYPVALPDLTAYKYLKTPPSDFPISRTYAKEILSLPIYPGIGPDQIEYVVDQLSTITQALGRSR
ncbi:MAG: DegT/DnrJ/EryC1/StrS family aminotransferase [Rhodospirillales bacterium]|nr:DegT/DnrJ/EryC1/StrS family aminotransferase [Rhodospirillales bacterium]